MKATLALAALVTIAASPLCAQTTTYAQPSASEPSNGGNAPVQKLLADGFEIKTGFSDTNGGAYMVLQKATSAYMCHSNPMPTCQKLN